MAWVRSISASSAVCSARSVAVSAAWRWVRTRAPVTAGANETRPVTTPTSSAWGLWNQARKPTVMATVIRPLVTGIRLAAAGVPYTTAA